MKHKIEYNRMKAMIPIFILIGIIFFQVYAYMISIEHIVVSGDEFFTYGLANNTEDYLFIGQDIAENSSDGAEWMSAQTLRDYLVVNEGEEFDYKNVFRNQSKDVHPPFYYILVHTICSFMPGEFLLMSGRLINVIAVVFSNILLYLTGMKLFHERWYALLLSVSFASAGYIELFAVYTRMYTLLGLLCLLLTYVNLCIIRHESQNKNRILLFLIVFTGGLTHYYFYVFLAIQVGLIVLYRFVIYKDKIKDLLLYLSPIVCAGVLAVCVFPSSIHHILGGYRGDEIINGLLSSKLDNFVQYFYIITQYVFQKWKALIFILLLYLLLVWMKKKEKKINFEWTMLIGTFVGYFVAISYISVEVLWTYMSPIFLIGTILATGILVAVFKTNSLGFTQIVYILLCTCVCIKVGNAEIDLAKTTYINKTENIRLLIEDGIKDCVFVYKDWDNLFTNQIPYLLYMDEIYSQDMDTIAETDIFEVISNRKSEDNPIILYIHCDAPEEILSMVEKEIGKELEFTFKNGKFCVYQ